MKRLMVLKYLQANKLTYKNWEEYKKGKEKKIAKSTYIISFLQGERKCKQNLEWISQ